MYDILQLNDMLVPELLDIAEQLKIPNAKKLDKQELVYKILDRQAVVASEKKTGAPTEEKTKRKRIVHHNRRSRGGRKPRREKTG
jgi:transcription termination factor Rho